MSIERLLKTIHGWLGVLILPWVVIAGVTGLYENHQSLVVGLLPSASTGAERLQDLPTVVISSEDAAKLASSLLSGQPGKPENVTFKDRKVLKVDGAAADLYVDLATGAYWINGTFIQSLYQPDGRWIASSVRWSNVLSRLHRRGWVSDRFGTWPADMTASALTIFGISGLYLFVAPRIRRSRNRRARLRAQT